MSHTPLFTTESIFCFIAEQVDRLYNDDVTIQLTITTTKM